MAKTGGNSFIIEDGVLVEYNGNEKNVVIPNGVTKITRGVFADKKMETVTLPNSLRAIDDGAFSGCKNIVRIALPNGLIKIGNEVFNGCENLRIIEIPKSVLDIGDDVFVGCHKNLSILGEVGSPAFEYAKGFILFRTRSAKINVDICKTQRFDINGEIAVCTTGVDLYKSIVDFYASKKIRTEIAELIKKFLPEQYDVEPKETIFALAISKINKIITDRISNYGITVSLYELEKKTDKKFAAFAEVIKHLLTGVHTIIESISENIDAKVSSLKMEIENQVTGLSYGVIGSSLDVFLHDIDDARERAYQRGRATAIAQDEFRRYSAEQQKQAKKLYAGLYEKAISVAHSCAEALEADFLDFELATLEEASILDLSTIKAYDREKSDELCNSALKEYGDQRLVLSMAIARCPNNIVAIAEAIHRGYSCQGLEDLIALQGIEAKVATAAKSARKKYISHLISMLAKKKKARDFISTLTDIEKEVTSEEIQEIVNQIRGKIDSEINSTIDTIKMSEDTIVDEIAETIVEQTISANNWAKLMECSVSTSKADDDDDEQIPAIVGASYKELISSVADKLSSKKNAGAETIAKISENAKNASTLLECETMLKTLEGLGEYDACAAAIAAVTLRIKELKYAAANRIISEAKRSEDCATAIGLLEAIEDYADSKAKLAEATAKMYELKVNEIAGDISPKSSGDELKSLREQLTKLPASHPSVQAKIAEIDKILKKHKNGKIKIAILIPVTIILTVLLFIFVVIPFGSISISGNYTSYINTYGIKVYTVPEGTTVIPSSAFRDCDTLETVIIPDSVTSIGKYAFYNCASLTSIVIPDSVTSIGNSAFHNCDSLTSVKIPDSVTSIDKYAFYNCASLTSIEIPDSVTSIGDSAFSDCTSLTSVVIGDSVTSIGDYAFYKCISLTSIVIPDSVTSIGYGAFSDCTSLTNIKIPDSVTSIGNAAFWGCTSLTSIEIPDSVTSISSSAFYDCSSLTSVTCPASMLSYLPDSNLQTVVITSGDTIPSSAFRDCSSLTSIVIPDSVTSIGYQAFRDCTSLTSIVIPDSVTSIGDGAFWTCESLTSVVIPNSVTSIGEHAFQNCTSLTSIEIPDSVTSIGYSAFAFCRSLTSIEIPDSVKNIVDSAFYKCISLTSIVIPDSVTSIGDSAFDGCDKLVEVINKSSLSITVGSSDNGYVGYYAKEVHNGESKIVNQNDYLFYTYNGVNYLLGYVGNDTELVLPDNYNGSSYEIYKYAFSYRRSLTSVVTPDSVTSIGNYAFYECTSLTSIVIPDSVTSIGNYAFEYCKNLTSIKYRGTQEQWNAITKGSNWSKYTGSYTITYNYTGK